MAVLFAWLLADDRRKDIDRSFIAMILLSTLGLGFQWAGKPTDYVPGPSPAELSGFQADYLPLEAPEPFAFRVRPRLMPFDAAKIAFIDASRYPDDARFFRYIFLPERAEVYGPMVNLTVNLSPSSATLIQFGYEVHPQVLRYDLRLLAPQAGNLKTLIDVWEELAFDAYFHEFLTAADDLDDALDAAIDAFRIFLAELEFEDEAADVRATRQVLQIAQLQAELTRVRTPNVVILNQFVALADKFLLDQGKIKTSKKLLVLLKQLRDAVAKLAKEAGDRANVEVVGRLSGQGALAANQEVVVPARHAGVALEALFDLVQSDAAIVYAPYFIHRALSSENLGFGAGLYYLFNNVRTNVNDGKTDFQRALADLGVDLEVVGNLRSKNSSGIFDSNVTGRERKIVFVQGSGVAPTRGTGLVVYTQDPSIDQSAAKNSPVRNVIDFEFAAQELIGPKINGLPLFELFNSAGVLQNRAPDTVVVDRTTPAPHLTILQSFSCFRCHGPQKLRMSVPNDVRDLTRHGVDILDDISSGDGKEDLFDRLTGEYESNPLADQLNKPLERSRIDFQEGITLATSGMLVTDPLASPGSRLRMRLYGRGEGKGLNTVDAMVMLASIYDGYTFGAVTPMVALKDLGYDVASEKEAIDLIRLVLSPTLPDAHGLTLVDVHIESLRIGLFRMPRPSWELVYFDGALRSMLTAKLIRDGSLNLKTKIPTNPARPLKKRPATRQRLTFAEQLRRHSAKKPTTPKTEGTKSNVAP